MKNSTLIKILIVLIIIFIFSIFLISKIIGGDSKKESSNQNEYNDTPFVSVTEHETKYDVSTINTYYTSLTTDDRDYIDQLIDSIVEKINQKNYEDLFAYLDAEYSKFLFNNEIDNFKKYIDENFASDCYCIDYRISNYGCFLNLGFEGDSAIKTEIQIQNFKKMSANDIKLFFDDMIEITSINDTFNTKDIVIGQLYIMKYPKKMRLHLILKNSTNQAQTIDFAGSQLEATNAPTTVKGDLIGDSIVTLVARENKNIEFDFNYDSNNLYDVDAIKYQFVIGDFTYKHTAYIFLDENVVDYEY